MLRTLLESNAAPTRRRGGILVSIGLHTAVIALAVAATARANLGPLEITPERLDSAPIYASMPTSSHDHHPLPQPPRERWLILPKITVPPVTTSLELPAIDNKLPPIGEEFRGEGWASACDHCCCGGTSDDPKRGMAGSAIHTLVTVDWAARPNPNNPSPVYPAALRSAQLEGAVVAQFIVDTLGRAEPASINIKEATHPLFGDAVRQALLRSRYEPAMVSNRKVRQLVEQRFTFTLLR